LLARGLETPRDALDVATAAALRGGLGGDGALMVATRREHSDAAAALLAAGCDSTEIDACLHAAAGRGSEALVEALLEAGGDAGKRMGDPRTTAVALASRAGHAGVLRLLLKDARGAAAAGDGDGWGRTPLHEAVFHLRLDAIRELLLQQGPGALSARDADDATPLHVACYWTKGRAARPSAKAIADKILELLLDVADPAQLDAKDGQGCAPLERAARADGDQIFWVARFLAAGAAAPDAARVAAAKRGNDRVAALLGDDVVSADVGDDDDDVWAAARRGDVVGVRARLRPQKGVLVPGADVRVAAQLLLSLCLERHR